MREDERNAGAFKGTRARVVFTSVTLSRTPAGAAILPFSLPWSRFRNLCRVLFSPGRR